MGENNDAPEPFSLPIRDEMIRLGQALKLASLVEDGVQAREVVEAELVFVNGESETRRGRQLRHGDCVRLGEESFLIVPHSSPENR